MIDWENERIISLRDVPKFVKSRCSGKRVALATVWRWAMRPNNPLETFSQGGGRFTSVDAIGRFIQRCSNKDAGDGDRGLTQAVPNEKAVKAGEELRKLMEKGGRP
jgi:hypothetical protein